MFSSQLSYFYLTSSLVLCMLTTDGDAHARGVHSPSIREADDTQNETRLHLPSSADDDTLRGPPPPPPLHPTPPPLVARSSCLREIIAMKWSGRHVDHK